MSYPSPPFGTSPASPAIPASAYPPPYSPYGFPRPPEPPNQLLNLGGALTAIGGLIVGIGWIAPTEFYWVILGIGWMMFGPGLGMAILGLGKQRGP